MRSAATRPAVELAGKNARKAERKAESVNPAATMKRTVFARISIAAGNTLQIAGMLAACCALSASRSAHSTSIAAITMILAWVLLYFSSHAIAHWLVGQVVGIRFLFYTVGGQGIHKAGRLDFVGSLSVSPS